MVKLNVLIYVVMSVLAVLCELGIFSLARRGMAPKETKLYDVLEIKHTATQEEIKKAFRRLSKKYHPDRAHGTEEKFKNIADAYNILSDKKKKDIYDRFGYDAAHNGGFETGGAEGFDPSDIFSQFFGGKFNDDSPKKSATIRLPVYVSLEQIFFGDYIDIDFERKVLCMHAEDCYIHDSECAGAGVKMVTQHVSPGFVMQNQIADDSCIAKGKAWDSHCTACPNGMSQLEKTMISVHIEKGCKAGEIITFDGVGQQTLGSDAGDVEVVIKIMRHPVFNREGHNLRVIVTITLEEALLGFEKHIKHVDGSDIPIIKSNITYDGEVINKKGYGLQSKKNSKLFGNMYVVCKVKYPKKFPDADKEFIKKGLANAVY